MKITQKRLKEIINEEVSKFIEEDSDEEALQEVDKERRAFTHNDKKYRFVEPK